MKYWLLLILATSSAAQAASPHNLILFVPDGLRAEIVDSKTAPTFAHLRDTGVNFTNSHSLFPTFTTANASAFATGHGLADTGDFSNYIYTGFRVTASNGTVTPFLESDPVLRQVNDLFHDNYLNETAIVNAARAKGYATALIGKLGPVAIFDVAAMQGEGTLIVDDTTGTAGQEVPLSAEWKAAFAKAKVAQAAPARGDNGNAGNATTAGTWVPNLAQQQYFVEAAIKVALPHFKETGKPFVLVFWSRDPDGTQHNQGDSFHKLAPGINGATSLAAVRNADTALELIEATLQRLDLYDTTNIVVAADHGFSTIWKAGSQSPSVKAPYKDVTPGDLPLGFLAIDLYSDLKKGNARLKLFDPDDGYKALDWMTGVHPARGNAIIGEDPDHPLAVVAANGGSDLIYLPTHATHKLARTIVAALLEHDYVSGVFVDQHRFGEIPGALSTESIGVGNGAAVTPHPDIVVNFASKRVDDCPRTTVALCTAVIADTPLQQGQGMHGSFSRSDTYNFMAARGPDFRTQFADPLPASNADIGMTLAKLLDLNIDPRGKLSGRVLAEALAASANEPAPVASPLDTLESKPGAHGLKTVLKLQRVGNHVYYTTAGFAGRTAGLAAN